MNDRFDLDKRSENCRCFRYTTSSMKMGVENILINNIGTVIGSHTGPGVVAVFCMGNER